jgi:ElaB/YqjD/DUF883 family membrane-anchored ribosome-binding protein
MLRSSPAYLKTRAKEAAVRKTVETRDRVQTTLRENPTAWKVIGGALGVGLGSMLAKRFQHRDYERRYIGYSPAPYGGYSPAPYREGEAYGRAVSTSDVYGRDMGDTSERMGARAEHLKERLSETTEVAQEKLSHATDVAQEKLSHAKDVAQEKLSHAREAASDRAHDVRDRLGGIRERIPSREEIKYRAQDTWHRRVESDPLPILLGALALGAAASFLLPVSDRERQLTGPARDKVRSKLGEAKEQATSRFQQVKEQAGGTLSSFKDQAEETLKGQQGESPLNYGMPSAYDKNLPH